MSRCAHCALDDEDRAVRRMHHVTTDATKQSTLKTAATSRTEHNDLRAPFARPLDDGSNDRRIHHDDVGIRPSSPQSTPDSHGLATAPGKERRRPVSPPPAECRDIGDHHTLYPRTIWPRESEGRGQGRPSLRRRISSDENVEWPMTHSLPPDLLYPEVPRRTLRKLFEWE